MSYWQEIEQRSLIPRRTLNALWREAVECLQVPGDAAELGCWRGGSALMLRLALPGKPLHCFESFEGLTDLSAADGSLHRPGDFALSAEQRDDTIARLEELGVVVHPGRFAETLPAVVDLRFAFVHFDADTYAAARECLAFFLPRLSPGGRMVLDDYRTTDTPGVAAAVAHADLAGCETRDTGEDRQLVITRLAGARP